MNANLDENDRYSLNYYENVNIFALLGDKLQVYRPTYANKREKKTKKHKRDQCAYGNGYSLRSNTKCIALEARKVKDTHRQIQNIYKKRKQKKNKRANQSMHR